MAQVAIDLIPPESLLSQLHHSQQILDFLATVIGAPVLGRGNGRLRWNVMFPLHRPEPLF